LVILCGTVVDFRLSYGRSLPKGNAKIVSANRSREQLELNTGWFGGWKPTLQCECDPLSFLVEISKLCPGGGRFDSWAVELKQAEAQTEMDVVKKAAVPAFGHGAFADAELINPLALVVSIESTLPDKSILIGDGGDFVASASYVVRPRGPLRWLDPGAFGTLGVGAGFALGAKLACPEAEVWLFWGDGAAGYSISEVDTFARLGLSAIAVVGNDAMWGQIERDQTNWLGSAASCELNYTEYDKVAEGFGGVGLSVAKPDEIAATLAQARQIANEDGKFVLINALIGRSDFREGSISV
jgi:acetolactate synthase-like protein